MLTKVPYNAVVVLIEECSPGITAGQVISEYIKSSGTIQVNLTLDIINNYETK